MTVVLNRSVPGGTVLVEFPCESFAGRVTTTFDDGLVSKFDVAQCADSKFKAAAREMGYGDRWQWFGVEHDLAHHFVAVALKWPFSRVVWASAHGRRPDGWKREWPYRPWDEEHIVVQLQRYIMTGQTDSRKVLTGLWGDRLPHLAAFLVAWVKPWLVQPTIPFPDPIDLDSACWPLEELQQ